jgi:hypothetical protein
MVFFMGNLPHVDLAGVEFLIDLAKTCRLRGIEFRLADLVAYWRRAVSTAV